MRLLSLLFVVSLLLVITANRVCGAAAAEALPRIPRLSYPPPVKDIQVELPSLVKVDPEFRPKLPVYLAFRPQYSPLMMRAIENVMQPVVTDTSGKPGGRPLTDPGKVMPWAFSYSAQSGTLCITDPVFEGSKVAGHAQKGMPSDAVNQNNAAALAERFLKDHAMWADGAIMSRVLENWRGRTYLTVFRHQVPSLPYMIAGDRLELDLDRTSGKLHTLVFQWSNLHRVNEYPIMTAQEAVARINQGYGLADTTDDASPLRGVVEEINLYYDAGPERTAYAQPVYRFGVVPKEGKGEKRFVRIQAIRPEFLSETFEGIQKPPETSSVVTKPSPMANPAAADSTTGTNTK
jgi:hypothetical protein